MAFPQWQPGLSSEQVKFALCLKRPTITLTSVQTRSERQDKFWIFMKSYIDFSFEKFFFYEFSWSFWVFLEDFFFLVIDFLFQNFFFMSIFERFFFLWVIYWLFMSYSMTQRTSTEVLRILRPRTERVNYLDYLHCLKVMNFLVNVCIFPLSKKR